MPVLEVLVRLLLIAGSAGINLDGHLSVWLSAAVGLAAMVATVELAVRPYGATLFDRLLMMAGSLLAALILLGVVLNFTPWGMTLETWNVAWAVLGLLVLFWRRQSRTQVRLPKIPINVLSLSIVLAAAIIIGAGALAISAVRKWDGKPVLAFSLVSSSATTITTEIDATSVSGRYSIVAFPQVRKTSRYTSKPISVSAGTGGQTIQERVPVSAKGTWVIDLEPADGGTVIRELIVDVE